MASDALLSRIAFSVFQELPALLLIACLTFNITPATANARILIHSETDLPYTYKFDGLNIKPGNQLQLKGRNNSDSKLILIIRIDNLNSDDYYSRYNRQFSIQPGDFSLTVPLTGLKTSGKQPLSLPYTKMIIFTANSSDDALLSEVKITPPPPRPRQVLAVDFGKVDSPVFPGFEQVTANDKRLSGQLLQRFRPSGDSLIQDGLEGLDTFSTPWENGEWKLTLWQQEQGEWEYLPHFLKRKILVEGQPIFDETYSHEQWLSDVYFAGSKKEALIDGDHWQLIGERRTKPVTSNITIKDNTFTIQWIGDRSARYAAGLVLEPLHSTFANEAEQQRKQRFLESWPASKPDFPPQQKLSFADKSPQPFTDHEQHNVYHVGRNTLLNLQFQINSPEIDNNPVIVTANPRNSSGQKLTLKTRYGHWRYERPTPNANELVATDSYLRADLTKMTLQPKVPRNIYVQVEIPDEAPSGLYKGSLQLLSKGTLRVVEFAIDVLPVTLPDMNQSVGLYLEPAPFYEWFPANRQLKPLATACDLALMSSMGFNNVAPPLATPKDDESRKTFIQQMKQLRLFGFDDVPLAYTPLKHLLSIQSADEVMASLATLRGQISSTSLQLPYWSLYDEPHPDKFTTIKTTASKLHSQSLDMRTAGHLNNPKQSDLLDVTDLAIMNHGYGVSKDTIESLQSRRKVWLYNMPAPRLAAGFYLWHTHADGYLQWHGRMPTADPFDPTDGREGDVIYMYPWQGSCPNVMDIHKRLLDLHEATIDLRWLQWLENQAGSNAEARALVEALRSAVPDDWDKAYKNLSNEQLMEMRQSIIELAKRLSASE
ncbi:hypothetical protein GZ77_24015 [Endozoicomonas montiporae]|uniref:Glycoside hydrolase 123 C-terminal domain-containing protein n=2 Tax=Endozoicomonas montiporae TaxID=1027273 RepID=A0A081MZG9_9GAMM|nr:hypothetical protein [Endozoicomonas montiporae]AMO54725.1 hypothetical protein EZMO1_0474 [Endozoicomonas montiporae CL-33]KEQ11592.1 hypothetical protein GZ77_24015 [Endozoicomonas montiporae]